MMVRYTVSEFLSAKGSFSSIDSHHGCYLAVKIVSNILRKAQGRKFEKEWIQFIDIMAYLSILCWFKTIDYNNVIQKVQPYVDLIKVHAVRQATFIRSTCNNAVNTRGLTDKCQGMITAGWKMSSGKQILKFRSTTRQCLLGRRGNME